MKLAETLQAGINYGQGNREIYKSYDEYTQTLQWLQTPLLAEGFALKNFSSLSLTRKAAAAKSKRCSPLLPSSSCSSRRSTAPSPLFWSLLMTARSSCCAGNRSRSSTIIRPPSPAENTAFGISSAFHFFSQPLTTQKRGSACFTQALPLFFLFLIFLLSHRRAVPFGKAFQYPFIRSLRESTNAQPLYISSAISSASSLSDKKGHRHMQHMSVECKVVCVVHRFDADGCHIRSAVLQLQQLVGHIHPTIHRLGLVEVFIRKYGSVAPAIRMVSLSSLRMCTPAKSKSDIICPMARMCCGVV